MKQILVYADSLSWGIVPGTRNRLPFAARWPGVLERELAQREVRVIENCLNGRRTTWDDPFKPGRNGVEGLAQVIEMHSPLALVIVMLGTNDFQSTHANNAWHSAQGISRIVTTIRQAPMEPGMPVPPVLVIAPPPIGTPRGAAAEKFAGADVKCHGLADAFRVVCAELRCGFFDAAAVIACSEVDGVHLDEDRHGVLGRALAAPVMALLHP